MKDLRMKAIRKINVEAVAVLVMTIAIESLMLFIHLSWIVPCIMFVHYYICKDRLKANREISTDERNSLEKNNKVCCIINAVVIILIMIVINM